MLLKKRKHLEAKQLLSASVAVKARRTAVNLMNGDAYAESMSMTSERTRAFDSALIMFKYSEAAAMLPSAAEVIESRTKLSLERLVQTPYESVRWHWESGPV